jgi:hypothetical protein
MGKNKNDKKKNKNNIDIRQYDRFSGISHRELNFGLWIAKNKKNFIISVIVILILLSAGFFLYSGYHYSYYLLEGKEYDEKLANDLSQYDSSLMEYRMSNPMESLEIKSVQSFKTDDKMDLVSEIHNPNGSYYARFEYCFIAGETELLCDSEFIFPLETKYLIALALDNNMAQKAELRFTNVSWSRIDAHKYPDWSKYYSEHLNFETKDIRFRPARQNLLSDKMSLDVLEFNIKNKTAYNYWELPLNILLYNNSKIVGVHKHKLSEFLSGTERSVRLVWSGSIVQSDEIKITPRLNILDPDIYIKY